MPQAVQVARWKTFDGRDFATRKEAEAHEEANLLGALVGLDADDVQAAVALAPGREVLTAAIERAALDIKRARRAKAEAAPATEPQQQPDP